MCALMFQVTRDATTMYFFNEFGEFVKEATDNQAARKMMTDSVSPAWTAVKNSKMKEVTLTTSRTAASTPAEGPKDVTAVITEVFKKVLGTALEGELHNTIFCTGHQHAGLQR